jgi:hypothetical protein
MPSPAGGLPCCRSFSPNPWSRRRVSLTAGTNHNGDASKEASQRASNNIWIERATESLHERLGSTADETKVCWQSMQFSHIIIANPCFQLKCNWRRRKGRGEGLGTNTKEVAGKGQKALMQSCVIRLASWGIGRQGGRTLILTSRNSPHSDI